MKVHSGIKPYCCQYCPFSSEFRSSLLRHIKRHTHANEKPYRCGRCSYQSRYKWNVTVHMRKCHDKDNNYRHMLQAQSPNDLQGLPRISNVFSGNPSSELSSSEISSSPESMPTSVNITCASASNSIVVDKGVENQNKQTASIDDRNDRDFRPGSILEAAAQRKLMEFTHIQSVYTSTPISHTVQRKSIDNASFTQPDSVSISSASQPGFDTPIYSLSMPMASINARPKQAASLVQHVDKNHSPPIVPVSLRVTPQLLEKNPAKDRLVSESCQTEQVENPDCSCSNMKSCNHCGTFFTDNVIYTLHMSCHGNRNPFQCGICGYECRDKIEFTCHITRSQHKK
uniref:Zinc finger protein Pegasus-like n=1 Tax=Saccoglossus kowalevskii TaxID=10224 RepID=A0ABM0MYC3_SACKO|nr:PREDICTED: zinc finger protein Pegasus-like [Saccoglossus kowalevskii]